jgi:hypothetical protein
MAGLIVLTAGPFSGPQSDVLSRVPLWLVVARDFLGYVRGKS